ncbi:MAG: helix-turn-helix domain-containing protein [Bryobacteraceae bacterium]|nr:helix-turn-helix domain-containing protein [Bryobacteraceae bacterium]
MRHALGGSDSGPDGGDGNSAARSNGSLPRAAQPHVERDVPLPRAALEAGVPLRTAQRWLARYRASGVAGLARLPRADLGQRKVPAEVVKFVEGLFLRKPKPSVASIYRRVLAMTTERQWPAPSYASVYTMVRGLDPAMSRSPTRVRQRSATVTNWCTGIAPNAQIPSGKPITPTIKVPVGYRFTVRVNRDILFEAPYEPLQADPQPLVPGDRGLRHRNSTS